MNNKFVYYNNYYNNKNYKGKIKTAEKSFIDKDWFHEKWADQFHFERDWFRKNWLQRCKFTQSL